MIGLPHIVLMGFNPQMRASNILYAKSGVSMFCTNRSGGFQLEVINIIDVVDVISDWLCEAGGAPCRRLDAGDGR